MAEQGNRIQFLQDALKKLAKSVKEVSGGLINLENVIKRLKGETTQLSKSADKTSASMTKTAKETKKATTELKKNETQTKGNTKANKGFFSNIGKNIKTIASFYGAYQLLNLAGRAFTELTIGSAKRAIALEKALADLRAVAGLTAADISRLKTVVFEVAGVTSLTSLEVVELQKQLAKLGSSTSEIENLTRPIALLSQALGEDAGGVAGVLKKTLNQFQATSEEADRFANILTGAVNETALSLTDLGTALGYVGPLGSQIGVTFEETAALLGILADNGFKASKAGTGLRTIFIAAAKDGRPFNEFIEELGNSNLQAAESVETFGRIAASQGLTLSKNVQSYKDLSEELKTSSRLFDANVSQMGSTEGQMKLLVSAYDKFSTSLGEVITKTSFFINLTRLLSPETASQAKAFQILSKASDETKGQFEDLTSSLIDFDETIEESAINTEKVLIDLLVSTGQLTDKTAGVLTANVKREGITLEQYLLKYRKDLLLTVRGLTDVSMERASILREERIAQSAVNDEYTAAKNALLELEGAAALGNLTEEKREAVLKKVKKSQTDATKAYNDSNDVDGRKVLEKRIALYEEIVTSLNKVGNSQNALDKKEQEIERLRAELRKNNFKDELVRIQSELDTETDRVKAVTDLELEGSKGAEDAAQIRLKQEKLVQAAYSNSANKIRNLISVYPEFISEIGKASESYEKFTQFTQSNIGQEGINILSDYKTSFQELGKQLSDEKITLAEYDAQQDSLEASLISSITTLKSNTGANEELKNMLDKVVVAYLNAKKGSEDYQKETKGAAKGVSDSLDWGDVIVDSIATASEAINSFNDVSLENTKNRLNQELDAIRFRYETEENIIKSQLDNQLITESQYRQKQKDLRKAQIRDENDLDRKLFNASQKSDRQNASVDYLQAIASIIPTLIAYDKTADPVSVLTKAAITGALATASYGAELSAIGQRKFFPKKFAGGGVVNGPSHNEGGVPFSVQGQGGYEMEGGEYIINKRATSMHRDLLDKINKSGRTSPTIGNFKYAQGGLVNAPLNESVDYLKAIAEATTSTAIGVSKPVRAYISDKDLRSNSTERRIRDRNDRI